MALNSLTQADFGVSLQNYLPILVFLGLAFFISSALIFLSWIRGRVVSSHPDRAAPYECGFFPLTNVRARFDVRFYLIAILFIIFDVEIAFLFPWAVSLSSIGSLGFWSMVSFLSVLTVGFVYEWKKGALEWD